MSGETLSPIDPQARIDQALSAFSSLEDAIRGADIDEGNALSFGRDFVQAHYEIASAIVAMAKGESQVNPRAKHNPFAYGEGLLRRNTRRMLARLDKGDATSAKDFLAGLGKTKIRDGQAYREEDTLVLGEKLVQISTLIPENVTPAAS